MTEKKIIIRSRFKETQAAELPPLKNVAKSGNKFKVVLIQEGLGNLRDCFYYTKNSLQTASQLFEGKKCFADHPSSLEEETRPERSTRDILGHFENVQYEEAEDGRGSLVADLVVLTNPTYAWAQTLLTMSVGYAAKFPDSEFVGLSINASGQALEVPLVDFMKEAELPASVLPKLQAAQAEGIPMIRVVNSLKDAVSCDLVTEAGAGGKILQMIEQERKPMKQKQKQTEGKQAEHESEAEAHQSEKETESEAHQAEAGEDDAVVGQKTDGASDDHADADQDKALFAKMIKQYLGDDANADDEETHEMAKHAYECHKEGGMEHKEAYEAAGNHLKMAMAIGKKMHQKQKEMEGHEAEAESESEAEAHEAESGDGQGPEMSKKGKGLPSGKGLPPTSGTPGAGSAKESAAKYKGKLIQALGENARLREALKKYELRGYLDKKLSESKRSVAVTKTFREALGAPKSKEQIDLAYKLFMTGADVGSEDADSFAGFVFTEKNSSRESDTGTVGSFADCLES